MHAAAPCATHRESPAAYQCDGCGALLCEECVQVGKHLTLCGLCGELALPLGEKRSAIPEVADQQAPPAESPTPAPSYAPEPTYTPALVPPPRKEPTSPAVHLTNHVVVPAATIAMVVALLFYLLDVRSVFLGSVLALKWLGFWFVVATVLIARYGKSSGEADRQGCYTFALALATVLVMALSPWEHPEARVIGPIANSAIILVVWRFATRLTRGLSLESQREGRRTGLRLYGLERLRFEAWQRQEGRPSGENRDRTGKADARGNPSAAVARLALVALVIFAAGEPILLTGPPAAGVGAFAAMIVFLMATGVVLAAGSAMETLRHVHTRGGQASERVVPARVAMATTLMVVILAVALAMPGIRYQGSGRLSPENDRRAPDSAAAGEQGESRTTGATEAGDSTAEGTAGSLAAAFLGLAGVLGKLLWIPFLILVAIATGLFLWRLRPQLASRRRRLRDRLRALLAGLAARVRGLVGRRRTTTGRPRVDPLSDYESLMRLPPRDSVLAAYARLLATFDRLGYPRQEHHTPYELLHSLPAQARPLSAAAQELTALYVKAAYSTEAPDSRDRDQAVAALGKLKGRVAEIS